VLVEVAPPLDELAVVAAELFEFVLEPVQLDNALVSVGGSLASSCGLISSVFTREGVVSRGRWLEATKPVHLGGQRLVVD
jgi:hypothetical protein